MKVSPTTAPLDFTALKEVESAHDVNYMAGKLARRRAHYAFLFQRYQDILTLDDEGCEISVTLKSATKTVTLTSAESEECFCLNDMYQLLGNHLAALQAEILDLLEGKVKGKDGEFGLWEGTDAPSMRQVVALCMPQAVAPADAQPTVPNTAKAA